MTEAPQRIEFHCPPSMNYFTQKVLGGEYQINYQPGPDEHPVILDIGANCGAFVRWAQGRWPTYSHIYAYEPAQVNFPYLEKNCKEQPRVTLIKAAVTPDPVTKLYCGKDNPGQTSFFLEWDQTLDTYELPVVIHPKELPQADIIKADTEGCELQILSSYLETHEPPKAIMFEYHRDSDRFLIDDLLRGHYILMSGEIICPHRGTLKYISTKQLELQKVIR